MPPEHKELQIEFDDGCHYLHGVAVCIYTCHESADAVLVLRVTSKCTIYTLAGSPRPLKR
eukprot:1150916-Amphidinium_carterae.1